VSGDGSSETIDSPATGRINDNVMELLVGAESGAKPYPRPQIVQTTSARKESSKYENDSPTMSKPQRTKHVTLNSSLHDGYIEKFELKNCTYESM
jgi:hypothetical protein